MEDKQQYLDHILQNLPHKPGVYKMKDTEGKIIYIGKAKDLKKRVSSYFLSDHNKMMRTIKMVEHIADIEYIVVDTEFEALILETNLIKEHHPKYNVLMKDDKNYIYIKITTQDKYPRIFLVRKPQKDKARYFGPKTAAYKVVMTLKTLKRIFPYNHCPIAIDYSAHAEEKNNNMSEEKIQDHLKRCIGPCIFSVSSEDYRNAINGIISFLEGKHEDMIKKLKEDMATAAANKKFEVAAGLRDKLQLIEEITEKQRINDPHLNDLDIINYFEQDNRVYFNLFQLRNGRLVDQENFMFKSEDTEKQEGDDQVALQAFIKQYYEKATDIPKEILLPHEIEDQEVLEEWLSQMKEGKVHFQIPERGKKNRLLDLAHLNALSFAKQSQIKWEGASKNDRQQAMEELQKILGLPTIPKRMECYDISHFGGTETVSSMTVFENGFPKKEDYRKFKLHQQTSGEPNDFASMEETLTRRLKYLKPSVASADYQVKKAKKTDLEEIYKKLGKEMPIKTKTSKNKEAKTEEVTKSKDSQVQVESTQDTELDTITSKENTPTSTFYTLEKEGKKIGFAQITTTPSKKCLLENLEFEGPIDHTILFKKILEKCKDKRVYFSCPLDQQAKFEELGFQTIQKLHEDFKPVDGKTYLVFDAIKYKEDKSFKKIPDLIIIDGGKGQLSSAQKAIKKYHLTVPMVSLAKREEEIFLPENPIPVVLSKESPILHMIQHIRDEAHRFAVSYHKNLRLKATTRSILDSIFGIGEEQKMKLLEHFGSVEGIKNAPMDQIAEIVGKKNALRIKEKFINV